VKDALEIAGKIGVSGGFGFLFGWLIVWWVEPTTNGGTGLLVVISVVFWTTIISFASKLLGRQEKSEAEDKDSGKSRQQTIGRQEGAPQISDQWQC
jgi:hypothetical protein